MKATIIPSNFNTKPVEIESSSMHDLRVKIVSWFVESEINLDDKQVYEADKNLFLTITGKENSCMVADTIVNFTY